MLSSPLERRTRMHKQTHTLYLIRHGLTLQNLKRQYQGSILDYPILPESRILIEQRQKRGAVPNIATLWSSPLVRARQTAELYFPGMDIELMPDLMEREFGDWDGRTHGEMIENDPDYQAFLKTFGRTTPPGGESFDTFFARMERVMEAIEALARRSPEAFPLAIVFHGGPILHLTEHLLDDNHPFHRFRSKGAGGLQLEIMAEPLRVEMIGEIFNDDIPVEETPFYLNKG